MESTATAPVEARQQVNVYSLITDKFIEQLERGIVPWQKMWTSGTPTDAITRKPYYGINALILGMEGYDSNLFLTYNQAQGVGGKIRKGAQGHKIVYWRNAEEAKPGEKPQGQLKHYTVFNVSQCENIPEEYLKEYRATVFPAFETIFGAMPNCTKILHKEQKAWYDVVEDIVHMPKRSATKKDAGYYLTLFRQLIHSTGHDSRLARKGMVEMTELADIALFSKEDLIASIGACFLMSMAGSDPIINNAADYVAGWIAKLKQDKLLIFLAAKDAQKAVNYILDIKPEDARHTAE